MIARIFPPDYRGFYIDVGAADPEILSVTRHFYQAGWTGINIEPVTRFCDRLRQARPRDVTLNLAIGETAGSTEFFEFPEFSEYSGLDPGLRDHAALNNLEIIARQVEVATLESVCDRYVRDRDIDFLKIDVEGTELSVLNSGNWIKYRPVLVIVEAVEVDSRQENWHSWEPILTAKGYGKVWFDGLNNYYLREEDSGRREAFRAPPNVFDHYVTADAAALKAICDDRLDLINRLTAICEERLELIGQLDRACAERLEVINRRSEEAASLRQLVEDRGAMIASLQSTLFSQLHK